MRLLVVFGAGGTLGGMVLEEARGRGLEVIAAVRDPDRHSHLRRDGVEIVQADATDAAAVASASRGCDAAVASLYQEGVPHDVFYTAAAMALIRGLRRAGVGRLVVVGAAPNLETQPGPRLMDAPDFPVEYLPFAYGHTAGLHVLRAAQSTVDWLVLSPPPVLDREGLRTGGYRLGHDQVLVGPEGLVGLSYADLAIAVVDEAQTPTRHRTRAAVAH